MSDLIDKPIPDNGEAVNIEDALSETSVPTPAPVLDAPTAETETEALPDDAAVVDTLVKILTEESPTEPALAKARKSLRERLKELLTPKPKDDEFTILKGKDGKLYWHSIHTNNFKDREAEILTQDAHDNYIKRVDMKLVPMPVLQGWHTPGSEHGKAVMVWRNGHFVHAVGTFDDSPVAKKAIAYYRKNAGKLKLSHGFTAPDWAFDGTHYNDYNTFEISTLPAHAAANPYTSFEEVTTMSKERSPEKTKFLDELLGEGWSDKADTADENRAKSLEALRIEFKDHADVSAKPADQTPVRKELGELYLELVEGQNELIGMVSNMVTASKAKDGKITALEQQIKAQAEKHAKELNELRAVLNQPPKLASDDSSTVLTNGEKEKLKDALPKQDALSKWSGLKLIEGSEN